MLETSSCANISICPFILSGSVLHHYESELERHLSKYVGLGPTRRSNLDNLLMEGDLLEVTLDEVQQLWQLLQQDAQLLTSFQEKGAPETEKKVNKKTVSGPAHTLFGGPTQSFSLKKKKKFLSSL